MKEIFKRWPGTCGSVIGSLLGNIVCIFLGTFGFHTVLTGLAMVGLFALLDTYLAKRD